MQTIQNKGASNNATEKSTEGANSTPPKTENPKITEADRERLKRLSKAGPGASRPDVKPIRITVDLHTYARIKATQGKRDTWPGTLRRLLHMGLAEYERNARAGIHTAAQRAQQQAERDAQADAMQAERERQQATKDSRKRTRTAKPAAPAVLYLSGIPTTSSDTERSTDNADHTDSDSAQP